MKSYTRHYPASSSWLFCRVFKILLWANLFLSTVMAVATTTTDEPTTTVIQTTTEATTTTVEPTTTVAPTPTMTDCIALNEMVPMKIPLLDAVD